MLDQTEADTVHKFQGRQKQVVILTTVLDETWRGRTGLAFVDDPQMINVAVSRAIQRFILVTNNDMLPTSRHIRDLVGYIRYHNPGEDVMDSTVVSVFDLLYRAYSQRLRPLAARLRKELKYPSEDIIWTVLHDILAEQRYAHLTVSSQVLLRNLLPDLSRLTLAQRAYVQHRASVDFVVYNRVTNQPLLAIEVDGFAFHENNPDQRARDALKDEILDAHQIPLLRLPTTGSREHQRIRQALDNAEAHWARLSTRRQERLRRGRSGGPFEMTGLILVCWWGVRGRAGDIAWRAWPAKTRPGLRCSLTPTTRSHRSPRGCSPRSPSTAPRTSSGPTATGRRRS